MKVVRKKKRSIKSRVLLILTYISIFVVLASAVCLDSDSKIPIVSFSLSIGYLLLMFYANKEKFD